MFTWTLCDSEDNTTSASVKLVLTQVIKKQEDHMGKVCALATFQKLPQNLFIDGNNRFLWIFITARLLSVFTLQLVLCTRESRSLDEGAE